MKWNWCKPNSSLCNHLFYVYIALRMPINPALYLLHFILNRNSFLSLQNAAESNVYRVNNYLLLEF